MTQDKKESQQYDIYTIFTYRYIFDQKNDIVDLRSDVYDLYHFPERLMNSYRAEWQKYNQKAANKRDMELGAQHAKVLVNTLNDADKEKLSEYLAVIENTVAIDGASNIKVIKTDLRTYIESLLKI